ncbi:MAG: beta-propeller fold lactonase family protein [Pirellulales bacterium]
MKITTRRIVCAAFVLLVAESTARSQPFANFESPQAHPIAISKNSERLYAVNTPGYSLWVYSLKNPASPKVTMRVPVGIEPVSLAEHTANEIWVVSHVSDSISVVDLSIGAVVETIQVGDRPGDIVFAGNPRRGFVTSMTGRNVAVIDPRTRRVVGTIPIPGNDPRTLLASADGKTVWVAIGRSGNRTTVVPHTIAPPPPKPTSDQLPAAPPQGIIVSSEDPKWKRRLQVDLADDDVFEIDAAELKVRQSYKGAGTILFNLAQKPGTEELWVANTNARNRVRFEPRLKGHIIDSRVTRITAGANPDVSVSDLNPDLDYQKLPNPVALATALSQPTDVAFDRTGNRAYVAAFGTDRIGVLDGSGRVVARIDVDGDAGADSGPRTKRGPRALAVHPTRDLIYVLNRLSNSVSIVDTVQQKVLRELSMFDPTPKTIRQGRGFLFDAKLSGNGSASCASCHVDADRDGLAWDLGDPGGKLFGTSTSSIHPMKGPLLTQTLRGLAGERIFHWRADRPGLRFFNGTIETLLGGRPLNDDDMDLFVEYLQSVRFAANPHRPLDDTLPAGPEAASAKDGERIFLTRRDIGREGTNTFRCVDCHTRASGSGGFGFTGLIGQPTKAAQLRGLNERTVRVPGTKDRISGFGFGADGSKEDLIAFLAKSHRFGELSIREKESLQRFLLAFPTETAPIVGFTRTVRGANAASKRVRADLQLVMAQAEIGNCQLLVQGFVGNRRVSFTYEPAKKVFVPNRRPAAAREFAKLMESLKDPQSVLSFYGVPPGMQERLMLEPGNN